MAFARYAAAAVVGVLAFWLVFQQFATPPRTTLRLIIALLLILHYAAAGMHLRVIAARAATTRAGRYARQSLQAVIVLVVAIIVEFVLDFVQAGSTQGRLANIVRVASMISGLAIFVSALLVVARQFTAVGLLREDARRFLARARPS